MPSTMGLNIHTAVGLTLFDKNKFSGATNELFLRSEPGSPLNNSEHEYPEFDLGADQKKFAAGWKCVSFLERENSLKEGEGSFNPGANDKQQGLFQKIYKDSVHDDLSVRKEIGGEILKNAQQVSKNLDAHVSRESIVKNQLFCMDNKTFQGIAYLHQRDEAHKAVLSDCGKDIHVFLPGYATGDRYTLISAALIEPRLKISIGYTEGNQHEKASAEEAASVIEKALLANGESNSGERISLLAYSGKSLKSARESLDDGATRGHFSHESGGPSPLADLACSDTHIFHISVTTEIINRYFNREDGVGKDERHLEVKQKLHALVSSSDKLIINKLVDDVIEQQGIQKGSVALWVADRENANEREAEAISRPFMFELIADALEQSGKGVYFIADTYFNNASKYGGTEQLMNRQPYRPSARPHVGRFWAAEIDGQRLLAPRENQWYFMDRLLQTIGGSLVGIRSGALEPFALMGHNIIYLEHKGMFTPERHASWQGSIPYNRLITTNTTGYLKGNTESKLKSLIQENISRVVVEKKLTDAERLVTRNIQENIDSIMDDVHGGQITGEELKLLVAMTNTRSTAIETAKKIWGAEVV